MGLDEDIDKGVENLVRTVMAGWRYMVDWISPYFTIANTEETETESSEDLLSK